MFQLTFENQTFRNLSDFGLDQSTLPPYARAAFSFCREWLSSQEQFTQQTSGSTGKPKQIQVSRDQMIASAEATGAFFHTHSNSKLLCCLSPEYIAGKMMLVRAMVWDCPIWLVEPSSFPLKKIDLVPDFVAMVPLQLENSLQDAESMDKLRQITRLIIGGVAISVKLKEQLKKSRIDAWQTYGMTETVSHIALAKIGSGPLEYQTLPGVEIGQDERGGLWVKSPMSGTEKIQTNDLIELKSENRFSWLGRADFVINSGGVKLHPELLEHKAEAVIGEFFPGSKFFFFGQEDEKLGQKLVLIIEFDGAKDERARLLRDKLKVVLGKFEVPKEIYFRRAFSLTPTGKINRILTYQEL